MRLIGIVSILCLLAVTTFAQSYQPLIRPNVYWDVAYSAGAPICYYQSIHRYFFEGDTVANGQTYQKCNYYRAYPTDGGSDFCPPFAIDTSTILLGGYWREDTSTRQVFYYYYDMWGGGHQEDLIYDFTLNIGDSISNYGSGGTSYVTEIDSIQLPDSSYRKRVHFAMPPNLNSSYTYYIEGVGGSEGLFRPLSIAIGSWGYIMCLRENNEEIFGGQCDDYYIVDLESDVSPPDIQVSPNPTYDLIELTLPHQLTSIHLIDATGKLLESHIARNTWSISLHKYPAGMYVLRFSDINGNPISQKKLIKRP